MTICKLDVSEFSISFNFFLPPMRKVCVQVTLSDNLFDLIRVFEERRFELTFLFMSGIESEENEMLVVST